MINRLFVILCCCGLLFAWWDASTQPVRPHLDAYGDAVTEQSRTQRIAEWGLRAIWKGFAGEDHGN